MLLCEFCLNYKGEEKCDLGLKIPKSMSCREFEPAIAGFCAEPADFVNPDQIVKMASYFGLKGKELKKVKLMATREVTARLPTQPS
jgi:hypothetical protein